MKTLESIRREIKAKHKHAKELEEEILRIDNSDAIHDAIREGNDELYLKLKEAREAEAEREKKLSEELYFLKFELRILDDNAKVALFNEAYPIIEEACRKYSGKQYGEATHKKIYEEVKAKGYSFYFTGTLNTNRVHISLLNEQGYSTISVEGYSSYNKEIDTDFITRSNTINIENVQSVKTYEKYTENTKSAARKLVKSIKAYQEAEKKLEAQRSALTDILPSAISAPSYVPSYYVSLR